MSWKIQNPQVGEVNVTGDYPAVPHQHESLFNATELRLFRYTAVLFSLVVMVALAGSVASLSAPYR